jgi:hypothetical protein
VIKKDLNDISDFPKLDLNAIQNEITLGPYQLEQSFIYIASLVKREGEIRIFSMPEDIEDGSKIVKMKFFSRHSKNKEYSCYINYMPNTQVAKAVLGWYCTCQNGRRTVGCRSHSAALIYSLSFGKYQKNL